MRLRRRRRSAREVRRAAMYESNLGAIARARAGSRRSRGWQRFQLQVMSPIAPMLAQTANDVDEALATLSGDVAFEWKMDGARIQVHKQGDLVRIFTRSLNDVTSAIPEIADAARALLRRMQLVLDGEAIAFAADRPASCLPDHDAPLWPQAGRCAHAAGAADARVLLRLPAARRAQPGRACRRANASPFLSDVVPATQLIPRLVTRSRDDAQRRSMTKHWRRDTKA